MQEVLPNRAFPIVFEMVEPVGGLDQRWAASDLGIGDAHPVRGGAEVNVLAQSPGRGGHIACGGRIRLAYGADKTDALAGNSADQGLLLTAVADRSARRIDAAGQGRFRDDTPAPNRLQEIVLADDAIAVLHEVDQE